VDGKYVRLVETYCVGAINVLDTAEVRLAALRHRGVPLERASLIDVLGVVVRDAIERVHFFSP
jgi:hypothetical protein